MYKIIRTTPYWFAFSAILSVLSLIAIFTFGLRTGIDYKGGTVIEFTSSQQDKIAATEDVLNSKSITGYQIKEGSGDSVIVRLPVLSNDQHTELSTAIREKVADYNETSYDTVGPTVSRELTSKSIWAVILASIGIIVYIAYAFRRLPRPLSSWKFGASAVVALIHDLLITTGFVALVSHYATWMEVDTLFITALLTIMGFSTHDTIVVYDRLRENYIRNPHQDLELTAEESINQTLVRSINTNLTVIIVLLVMLLLGGETIRHFILTLTAGMIVGTYSSIFVAAALIVVWHKKSKALKTSR